MAMCCRRPWTSPAESPPTRGALCGCRSGCCVRARRCRSRPRWRWRRRIRRWRTTPVTTTRRCAPSSRSASRDSPASRNWITMHFDDVPDLRPYKATRERVREFVAGHARQGTFVPWKTTWSTFDAAFTRSAGEHGFIGMTWPRHVGGGQRSALERYVVVEEMLAAGAPCVAHWIAERHSGPQILRHGSDRARQEILPRIARGECWFGIGMSEPDVGSDLASVRTRADKAPGGWRINGSKVWTTNEHQVHYTIALVRTEQATARKHDGLTQFIVNMEEPGITVRPVRDLSGHHEFNQVYFEDCFVPDDMVVGAPGQGWQMVTSELSLERSGPDRFLSAYRLLDALVERIG